ncbi:MAG: hypothetical protein JW963_03310, partial [Anaerolineales bacterium]|nr:hypothetical protein [Anaerolineales bacterium]
MSIRRVVILVTIIIGLIIAISLAVWFLVEPEIQFFIYWIVGIIVAVLTIGAAIVQISGYSLRDLLRNDGYQIPEPKFPPDEIPEDNNLDEQELAVLLYIHDVGGENAVSGVVKVEQIREALSLEYSVIDRICRYLEGERLVKHFDDTGYRWVITHDGKKKARALLKSKETRPSSPEAGSSHPEYATCTEKHHKTILDETPMPYKYDVFLSHNSKDKPAVQELAER